MKNNKNQRGIHSFLITAVVLFLLVGGLFIVREVTNYPIYSEWWEREDIKIDYQYHDYMGINHLGTIDDRDSVRKLADAFKDIDRSSPPVIRLIEERTGALTYSLKVKQGNVTLLYSLTGSYLAVGKKLVLSDYSIYELTNENADRLRSVLQDLMEN